MVFEPELVTALEPIVKKNGCIVSYNMFPDAVPEVGTMYQAGHLGNLIRDPSSIQLSDFTSHLHVVCDAEDVDKVKVAVANWLEWNCYGGIKLHIAAFQ